MAFLGIDHVQIAIPPGREADAAAFYGDTLGMEAVAKPETLQANGGLWFRCGSQALHLGIQEDFIPARKAHPALLVHGVDRLVRRCRRRGVAAVEGEPIPGFRRFYVHDPFGNRIELIERVLRGAAEPSPDPAIDRLLGVWRDRRAELLRELDRDPDAAMAWLWRIRIGVIGHLLDRQVRGDLPQGAVRLAERLPSRPLSYRDLNGDWAYETMLARLRRRLHDIAEANACKNVPWVTRLREAIDAHRLRTHLDRESRAALDEAVHRQQTLEGLLDDDELLLLAGPDLTDAAAIEFFEQRLHAAEQQA